MQPTLGIRFALGIALTFAHSAAVEAQSMSPDEVEVSTFYQGEFDRPTFSLWGPRLACGVPLDEWAQSRCGKRRWIYKPVTDGVSGNRCGYRGFALVCFNK
jgi:hypothetical protein